MQAIMLSVLIAAGVSADEVIFKNGDRLTGTVVQVEAGKLRIATAVAGEVTVNLADVQTFHTDKPFKIRLQDNTVVSEKVVAVQAIAPATKPATQPAEIALGDKTIPPTEIKETVQPSAWKGAIVLNGYLERGDVHSESLGLAADAMLRRHDEIYNDRLTLDAAYNFGHQRADGVETTSIDNWFAQEKYDKFFTEKLYGYELFRYDHDRVAQLNYRLSPGLGLGYQWIERPDFNFNTEAGVNYVYEDYSTGGTQDRVALRLAYHLDKKLNNAVSIFHNVEWLPAFNDPGDYNLNADAGIRAQLTASMFTQFKVQWLRDSTPAPGSQKNDLRFFLGAGWAF